MFWSQKDLEQLLLPFNGHAGGEKYITSEVASGLSHDVVDGILNRI